MASPLKRGDNYDYYTGDIDSINNGVWKKITRKVADGSKLRTAIAGNKSTFNYKMHVDYHLAEGKARTAMNLGAKTANVAASVGGYFASFLHGTPSEDTSHGWHPEKTEFTIGEVQKNIKDINKILQHEMAHLVDLIEHQDDLSPEQQKEVLNKLEESKNAIVGSRDGLYKLLLGYIEDRLDTVALKTDFPDEAVYKAKLKELKEAVAEAIIHINQDEFDNFKNSHAGYIASATRFLGLDAAVKTYTSLLETLISAADDKYLPGIRERLDDLRAIGMLIARIDNINDSENAPGKVTGVFLNALANANLNYIAQDDQGVEEIHNNNPDMLVERLRRKVQEAADRLPSPAEAKPTAAPQPAAAQAPMPSPIPAPTPAPAPKPARAAPMPEPEPAHIEEELLRSLKARGGFMSSEGLIVFPDGQYYNPTTRMYHYGNTSQQEPFKAAALNALRKTTYRAEQKK